MLPRIAIQFAKSRAGKGRREVGATAVDHSFVKELREKAGGRDSSCRDGETGSTKGDVLCVFACS